MKVFWLIVGLFYFVGLLDLVWEVWTAPELPPGK